VNPCFQGTDLRLGREGVPPGGRGFLAHLHVALHILHIVHLLPAVATSTLEQVSMTGAGFLSMCLLGLAS